jgi:hypothetical protein
MSRKIRSALAGAALVLAAGVATAAAAATVYPTDAASYARWRVDAAFQVVAAMPPAQPFGLPMAQKGDLPVPAGCANLSGDSQAECMDVAYEPDALPSLVLETRAGTTSTLLRMDAMTVAGMPVRNQRSE